MWLIDFINMFVLWLYHLYNVLSVIFDIVIFKIVTVLYFDARTPFSQHSHLVSPNPLLWPSFYCHQTPQQQCGTAAWIPLLRLDLLLWSGVTETNDSCGNLSQSHCSNDVITGHHNLSVSVSRSLSRSASPWHNTFNQQACCGDW